MHHQIISPRRAKRAEGYYSTGGARSPSVSQSRFRGDRGYCVLSSAVLARKVNGGRALCPQRLCAACEAGRSGPALRTIRMADLAAAADDAAVSASAQAPPAGCGIGLLTAGKAHRSHFSFRQTLLAEAVLAAAVRALRPSVPWRTMSTTAPLTAPASATRQALPPIPPFRVGPSASAAGASAAQTSPPQTSPPQP